MATKILRIRQLLEVTGISRSGVYDRLNPKSPRHDASFPVPVRLGPRMIGFVVEDVDAWLKIKIDARNNAHKASKGQQ